MLTEFLVWNMAMIDFAKALLDPRSVFKWPNDVVAAHELTREQKIEILRRWEYDAREIEVADEEGMTAPAAATQATPLDLILKALRTLGAPSDVERSAPTKQGGR